MKLVSLGLAITVAACLMHSHGFSLQDMPDEGITSPTHQQHVGGMVFASQVIEHGAEKPATFVDHCVLGRPCYGRFYLPKSLRTSAHDPNAQAFALRATVDGTPMPDGVFQMILWWSSYNFTLFRSPSDDTAWEHPRWFLQQVASRLAPGEHVIDFAVLAVPSGGHAGVGAPLATGRLAFTVPPNARRIIAGGLALENRVQAEAQRRQQEAAASSNASSGESSSSESSSGESSSSESSSGEAAQSEEPKPSKPSCLPDGAATDDYNKCCGGHWRGTSGDFHCCSQVGGGNSTTTSCY